MTPYRVRRLPSETHYPSCACSVDKVTVRHNRQQPDCKGYRQRPHAALRAASRHT